MISTNFQEPDEIRPDATSPSERKRLVSLAYGYLGSVVDAEDIVQEALLRLEQSDPASIQNIGAWLTTVVTRLSIDKLRSAQHRREVYPGEWLPEPVFGAPTPEQDAITRSRLSVGLLYLLEKLEPEQRVVFVLREVFEHPYQSIAEIAGKSEAACRQLMVRARAALDRAKQAPPVPGTIAESIVTRFINALATGDEKELLGIIAHDAVLVADGGGKVPSILNPVYGADRITRFFLGLRKTNNVFEIRSAPVNSGPGMLTFRDGQLVSVVSVSIEDDRITAIYSVNNPDKIHVDPLAPLREADTDGHTHR
ncbi:MAG: RNA polymerase sigma factor SigJ [Acidobacteriota bacterium]|nr:RNA polymerase sigma factor SigJ [Acidobacteriota bacterium]